MAAQGRWENWLAQPVLEAVGNGGGEGEDAVGAVPNAGALWVEFGVGVQPMTDPAHLEADTDRKRRPTVPNLGNLPNYPWGIT